MKKKHLPIVIIHVLFRVHQHVEPLVHQLVELLVLPLAAVVVLTLAKEHVPVTHLVPVGTVVLDLANMDVEMHALILVKLDVREHVVQNAEMIVGAHAKRTALEVVKTDV